MTLWLNRGMLIAYRTISAKIAFCAQTKTFYGEILHETVTSVFLATSRQDVIAAMQFAIDSYWQNLPAAPVAVTPEA